MRNKILLLLLLHVAFLYGEANLAEIQDSLEVKPNEFELSVDNNHSTNKFTAIFSNKGTKNYQNRATIGAYADFNMKFSIKNDDNLDYPQDIYSDEFLVFNNNHNYRLGTHASYKLSSYITDNLLLKFNFDLLRKYHDLVSRQDVGLYELRRRVFSKRSIISLEPGIKYSGRDSAKFGSAFISVGLPVSLIEASEKYQYRHYYNFFNDIVKYSYRKEHIDLDLSMDAGIGIETMVKYISRQTMWNKFKQGYSLSFNFNSNIVSKDSLNTNFYFQEVKSLSILEYAFILDNYDFMINPYISYEGYLLSKDKESSSFKTGINMAMDYDSFRNLELDCGFEHFVYAPNSPEVKILYAHPKFNVFFYDLIYLSVWLDYEYHQISKNKTMENHGVGMDLGMLFDF